MQRRPGVDLLVGQDPDLRDGPGEARADRGLHLHGLQDHERVTGRDLIARGDRHRDDERRPLRAHHHALVEVDPVGDAVHLDKAPGSVGGDHDRVGLARAGDGPFVVVRAVDGEFGDLAADAHAVGVAARSGRRRGGRRVPGASGRSRPRRRRRARGGHVRRGRGTRRAGGTAGCHLPALRRPGWQSDPSWTPTSSVLPWGWPGSPQPRRVWWPRSGSSDLSAPPRRRRRSRAGRDATVSSPWRGRGRGRPPSGPDSRRRPARPRQPARRAPPAPAAASGAAGGRQHRPPWPGSRPRRRARRWPGARAWAAPPGPSARSRPPGRSRAVPRPAAMPPGASRSRAPPRRRC